MAGENLLILLRSVYGETDFYNYNPAVLYNDSALPVGGLARGRMMTLGRGRCYFKLSVVLVVRRVAEREKGEH